MQFAGRQRLGIRQERVSARIGVATKVLEHDVVHEPEHEHRQSAVPANESYAHRGAVRKTGRAPQSSTAPTEVNADANFVSVRTLAKQWDCSRTTVARLLERAGVQAYYFGSGRNGSTRYLRADVERFLSSVEKA